MDNMQMNFQGGNVETSVKRMNFLQRLVGVLVSPGAVMEDLAGRPRVLFGILASFLAMPLFYLSRFSLFVDYMRQSQLKLLDMQNEKLGTKMTPEIVESQLPFMTAVGIISVAFVGIVMLFFFALLFFAILKVMGGQGKFKAYLSVTGYAYVVTILYFIVTAAASFFTGSLHQTIPLTGLANLLPQDAQGSFVYGMANKVDLFNIWYYVVLAIGMAKVSKVKKTYVYGAVLLIYVIGLLIGGAGAGATSALLG